MGLSSNKSANTKEIFKHLCDQMHKLSAKLIDVDEAKAQSHLAKQANNLLKYELDRSNLVAKYGGEFNIREIETR